MESDAGRVTSRSISIRTHDETQPGCIMYINEREIENSTVVLYSTVACIHECRPLLGGVIFFFFF